MEKVALITGASSGIGLAFCKEYAKQGYHIVLVARTENKLREVSLYLQKEYSIKTTVIAMNLAQENAALVVYKEIKKRDIGIDVLINNAGIDNRGSFLGIPIEKIQQEISLHIVSLTNLTYLFLNEMVEKKSGIIINITSIASFFPTPYESVYGATKAYVLSLTESLYYEYKNSGVKILALCPGITQTNLFSEKPIDLSKARTPEQVVITAQKALKRGKQFVVDGYGNKLQKLFPRLFPRKWVLKITGSEGKKTSK